MWLCVLQSLLVSASGDDSESQAPWPTPEGKPDLPWVPSLEKPTGWTFPAALPPRLLISPEALLGFCFCPIGRKVDEVLFRWGVTGCKMKPASVVLVTLRTFVALPEVSENRGMVSGLSPLNSLQLQKLKVFAVPPLSQGLTFISPSDQPSLR